MELFLIYFSLFFDFIFLVFSIVLLMKNSPLRDINKFLGVTFLLMSACGFWLTFLNFAITENLPHLLAFYYPFSLIIVMFIGPSIYFYIRALLGQSPQKPVAYWLHALPALPAVIYVVHFALFPADERTNRILSDYENVRWQEYAINLLFYGQLTVYLALCWQMLQKQFKKARIIEVHGKLTDINWLRYFFGIAISFFFINTIICSFLNSDRINTLLGLMLMDALFLYFFIQSVWETGLLTHTYTELPKSQEPTIKMTADLAKSYNERLLGTMENQQPYLSEDCSIDDVADLCNIPRHHLSHLLNTQLDKSFADFINEYRIRFACQLLKDPGKQHLTIEALGQECGFGSKASFNRAFKKHTGYTPSSFRQKQNNQ